MFLIQYNFDYHVDYVHTCFKNFNDALKATRELMEKRKKELLNDNATEMFYRPDTLTVELDGNLDADVVNHDATIGYVIKGYDTHSKRNKVIDTAYINYFPVK